MESSNSEINSVRFVEELNSLCVLGSEEIEIRGFNVSISEVSQVTNGFKCDGSTKIKRLKIFALHTVIIDAGIDRKGDLEFAAIIAPNWILVERRAFFLDGTSGIAHSPSKVASPYSAGAHGQDGLPGNPGTNGGHFLGIGKNFVGAELLSVSNSGGHGGPGQGGADGVKGYDGKNPPFPSGDVDDYTGAEWDYPYVYGKKYGTSLPDVWWQFYGTDGSPGGNGGGGGAGGLPGIQGKTHFVNVSGPAFINSNGWKGSVGATANGGKGGIGGSNGYDLLIQADRPITRSCGWACQSTRYRYSQQPNGQDGIAGGSRLQRPSLPPSPLKQDPWTESINSYKKFIRGRNSNENDYLVEFDFLLTEDTRVKELYNTLGYAQELQNLVENSISSIPIYQSLQERILSYSFQPNPDEVRRANYHKALVHIYAATLSRVCGLKLGRESSLIVNLEGYLELSLKELEGLDLTKRQLSILSLSKSYKERLMKKTEEANDFITNQVSPELDRIYDQIHLTTGTLLDELFALQSAAHAKKEALKKKKIELQDAMLRNVLFGGLKVIGSVVSCLGPVGQGVGGLVTAGTTIGEQFATGTGSGNKIKDFVLPAALTSVKSLESTILGAKSKEVEVMLKELDEMSKSVKTIPSSNETQTVIAELRTKVASKDLSLDDKDDIIKKIKGQEEILKKSNAEDATRVKEILEIGRKTITVATTSFDVYNKIKGNNEEIAAVEEEIQKNAEEIKKMKKFEAEVHSHLYPLVSQIGENVRSVEASLAGSSLVALDVKKWKVQAYLKETRLTLEKFTEGFKAAAEYKRLIEQQSEALSALISIYDRIENYQNQMELSEYIAAVESPDAFTWGFPEALNVALAKLDFVLQSSVVMLHYEVATNAFLQWVFPFADSYIEETQLPFKFVTLDELVADAAAKLRKMSKRVKEYNVFIVNNRDRHLHKAHFGNLHSTQPFYRWKAETHSESIKQLFSGRPVFLNADIRDSDATRYAIKFRMIHLSFVAKGEAWQEKELALHLNHFRVNMTHMGNSLYQFHGSTYIINSDQQVLDYTFEERGGKPVSTNVVYDKLLQGDFMLSPYAFWKFQIYPANPLANFSIFESFNGKVDIELVGDGMYVDTGAPPLSKSEDHYKKVEFVEPSRLVAWEFREHILDEGNELNDAWKTFLICCSVTLFALLLLAIGIFKYYGNRVMI